MAIEIPDNINDSYKKFLQRAHSERPKSASSEMNYWKFEKANKPYTVRMLPLKHDNQLFTEVHKYHGITDNAGKFSTVTCLRDSGVDCPFCRKATQLWREFDKGGRTDKNKGEAAKSLFAKTEYISVIVDLNAINPSQPSKDDVKVFSIRSKALQDLCDTRMKKGQPIADFVRGRDVTITKKTGDNSYGTIVMDFDDSSEAFNGDRELFDKYCELSPDLSAVVFTTEAQVLEAYAKWENSYQTDEHGSESDFDGHPTPVPSHTATRAAVDTAHSLDDLEALRLELDQD